MYVKRAWEQYEAGPSGIKASMPSWLIRISERLIRYVLLLSYSSYLDLVKVNVFLNDHYTIDLHLSLKIDDELSNILRVLANRKRPSREKASIWSIFSDRGKFVPRISTVTMGTLITYSCVLCNVTDGKIFEDPEHRDWKKVFAACRAVQRDPLALPIAVRYTTSGTNCRTFIYLLGELDFFRFSIMHIDIKIATIVPIVVRVSKHKNCSNLHRLACITPGKVHFDVLIGVLACIMSP